jgi:hypothetical protein
LLQQAVEISLREQAAAEVEEFLVHGKFLAICTTLMW